jgi:hypothetical protein
MDSNRIATPICLANGEFHIHADIHCHLESFLVHA